MSIRVQRALRDLIHGPYGRWIMLGLLIVILCVFTVTQDIEDWLRGIFGGGTVATTSDVAGSFAVLPGNVSEVTHSGFESARRRIGLARAFLERSPMDRVRDTEVWSHLVLLEAAKQERIAVSVEDLREVIGRVVPDYIFNDPQEYRKWVRENFQGASAPALEAAVLEYLTAFRVRQIYRESFLVGPPATRKAAIDQAAAQNVEYAFGDYAALDASRFLAEAEDELKSEADPDKKLREFFDKDPSVKLDNERFRHPRRFKIELLYSIHANVDTDEELARIEALVKKAYPEAAFKEVNVADRKTYFGTYRDRLLGMAGKTWESLAKEVPNPDVPAPGTPPGPDEPGAQPPEKPDEPATPPAKPDEPVAPPAKPDEPAAQAGQNPAEPPKPPPELSPDQRQRVIDYGYVIVKDQVGREVTLRSVYEFLYTQAKDNVSVKEMFDRLKANDDPLNPICATEPGKGLLVYRYAEGSASTAEREKGFLDAVAAHKEIEVVSSNQYGGVTTESAFKVSENLLTAHKGPGGLTVQGIFCPNESTAFGMLRALEDGGLAGKVRFVGFDSSPKLVDAMAKGHMDATVVQDPIKMGYLAVKAMVERLQGKPVDRRIDTGATLITRDTMTSPEARALLNPDFKKWLKE